jgi:TonB-dependent SusC/RagA subfamily outer membrane receptor
VASVTAQELVRTPTVSVEAAMAGKIAGADIQSNSGAPGGGMQVQLRGPSSIIAAATPLYVVDGVIVSDAAIAPGTNAITRASGSAGIATRQDNPTNRIADINPNDIENIEILKGAAASAIYGSKASNGVILITTKRGRVGAPQFSITQRLGWSALSNTLGYRRFESQAEAVSIFGPRAATDWAPGKFVDHDRVLAGRKPLSYETALSVTGGTETTRYFASGLAKHDGGIVQNTYYQPCPELAGPALGRGARTHPERQQQHQLVHDSAVDPELLRPPAAL